MLVFPRSSGRCLLLAVALHHTCLMVSAKTMSSKKVREQCRAIFETAFPPGKAFTTTKDIKRFARLATKTKEPNYFACPEGGEVSLTNFTETDLLGWFKTNFDPDAISYNEEIVGEIMVAGNVCAFPKLFYAKIGECEVRVDSFLTLELDRHGHLVRYVVNFDEEQTLKKFGYCTEGPMDAPDDPTAASVRATCVEIFETLCPKHGWVTDESLTAFASTVAQDQPNYFTCPEGGMAPLTDYTAGDVVEWFKQNFDPASSTFNEWITGPVMVAGNVCSFDKIFVAKLEEDCEARIMSHLTMEVDLETATLIRWIDSFDEDDVEKALSKTRGKEKNAGATTEAVPILASMVSPMTLLGHANPEEMGAAMACFLVVSVACIAAIFARKTISYRHRALWTPLE